MARMTLQFGLPEEMEEAELSMQARELRSALGDLMEDARQKLKYGNLTHAESQQWEFLRNQVWEKVQEYDLQRWFP